MGRVMRKSSRPLAHGARWSSIATGLVRPGAEAVLLAGVAFGCAQIAWRIAEPASAGVPGPMALANASATNAMAEFQSPFAPAARQAEAAVPAAVSAIKLVGVRMSREESLSGAVLTFGDDLQRPFLIGQTITDGVQLAQVHADHIVVAFGDDQRSIALDTANPAPRSFALALMGKSAQPDMGAVQYASTGQAVTAAPGAQAVSLSDAANTPASMQWLLSTMGAVEMRNGAPYAWRVSSAPPQLLRERGLVTGDLILSVNGARPGDVSAVMAAARASRLEFAVERASGERTTLVLVNGFAS